jgi:hypothetical protein
VPQLVVTAIAAIRPLIPSDCRGHQPPEGRVVQLMSLSLAVGRWRRILVVSAALLLTAPILVGEAIHVGYWGHLGIGLHLDDNGYSIWGVNLTPLPVPVHVCNQEGDAGERELYRYRMERWSLDKQRWVRGHAIWDQCDWTGRPSWKLWWPGSSLQLVATPSLGDMDGLQPGDRVRFAVSTIYDWPEGSWLQLEMISPEHIIGGPRTR